MKYKNIILGLVGVLSLAFAFALPITVSGDIDYQGSNTGSIKVVTGVETIEKVFTTNYEIAIDSVKDTDVEIYYNNNLMTTVNSPDQAGYIQFDIYKASSSTGSSSSGSSSKKYKYLTLDLSEDEGKEISLDSRLTELTIESETGTVIFPVDFESSSVLKLGSTTLRAYNRKSFEIVGTEYSLIYLGTTDNLIKILEKKVVVPQELSLPIKTQDIVEPSIEDGKLNIEVITHNNNDDVPEILEEQVDPIIETPVIVEKTSRGFWGIVWFIISFQWL